MKFACKAALARAPVRFESSSSTTGPGCPRPLTSSRGVAVAAADHTGTGLRSPARWSPDTAAGSRRRRQTMAPGSCLSCRSLRRRGALPRTLAIRAGPAGVNRQSSALSHSLPRDGRLRTEARPVGPGHGSPRAPARLAGRTNGTSPGRNRLQTAGICPFVANAIDGAAHSAPRRRRRAAGSSAGWGDFGPRGGSEVGVGDFLGNGLHCGGKWVIVAPACGTRVAGLLPPSHPGSEFGPVHESP